MVRESFDIHFIIEKFPAILSALPVTLEITAVTLVLELAAGAPCGLGKGKRFGLAEKVSQDSDGYHSRNPHSCPSVHCILWSSEAYQCIQLVENQLCGAGFDD